MKREWVESIHRQCRRKDVAFFFKQWGGVRKDMTGRDLYGRTYDEMPSIKPISSYDGQNPGLVQIASS
jgi:protein gp37